jgi:hypothetical protein
LLQLKGKGKKRNQFEDHGTYLNTEISIEKRDLCG